MTLTRIVAKGFTTFRSLDVELGPGINVFVGKNGTGKTHLLKAAYSACSVRSLQDDFAGLLLDNFMPYKRRLGRLVHRVKGGASALVEIHRGDKRLRATFSNRAVGPDSAKVIGRKDWIQSPVKSAFVPVKEMLANAPGFRSLYDAREIQFERIYYDILSLAYLPALSGAPEANRAKLLHTLEREIDGRVSVEDETFFLKNKQGDLEFSLLAEGMRKLALLLLLIKNGVLLDGSILFWDEPEANINPRVVGTLVDILLQLQRLGVQILLATHDYVVLKELDLRLADGDQVVFHALYRDPEGVVRHSAAPDHLSIEPNAIAETFSDLFDREVRRSLGGL